MPSPPNEKQHASLAGGCHCGAVRFRVRSDVRRIDDCNCSICTKKAFLHWIVPKADFELLTGGESLTEYRFGTGVAKHTFCSRCGVHPFYTPRSHPHGVSVNLRCVDGAEEPTFLAQHGFSVVPFDGQNWEANVERIRS
ncbi:MAG: GFA family protein [Polyangiaceae bacterium]